MKQFLKLATIVMLTLSFAIPTLAQENKPAHSGKIDFKKLKSPVSYTKKSIKRGKMWFVCECTGYHGPDGKAQIDIIANATDLTKTKMWYSGFTEGEIYRSIRDGVGEAMPPYKSKIRKEEDLCHREQKFEFVVDVTKQTLRIPVVLPEVPADSDMYKAFKAYIKKRTDQPLPDHRKIDETRV